MAIHDFTGGPGSSVNARIPALNGENEPIFLQATGDGMILPPDETIHATVRHRTNTLAALMQMVPDAGKEGEISVATDADAIVVQVPGKSIAIYSGNSQAADIANGVPGHFEGTIGVTEVVYNYTYPVAGTVHHPMLSDLLDFLRECTYGNRAVVVINFEQGTYITHNVTLAEDLPNVILGSASSSLGFAATFATSIFSIENLGVNDNSITFGCTSVPAVDFVVGNSIFFKTTTKPFLLGRHVITAVDSVNKRFTIRLTGIDITGVVFTGFNTIYTPRVVISKLTFGRNPPVVRNVCILDASTVLTYATNSMLYFTNTVAIVGDLSFLNVTSGELYVDTLSVQNYKCVEGGFFVIMAKQVIVPPNGNFTMTGISELICSSVSADLITVNGGGSLQAPSVKLHNGTNGIKVLNGGKAHIGTITSGATNVAVNSSNTPITLNTLQPDGAIVAGTLA